MRSPPQFRMSVTRRWEKQQKLSTFIAQSLAAARGAKAAGGRILVIARSLQSPVVKAIAALGEEIAADGCALRMVVARRDGAAPEGWPPSQPALSCEVRLAWDPRLIEAHEQLVVGQRACWTGDSMRRDPAACDAYESFIDDCTETAGAATVLFERFWIGGGPILELGPSRRASAPASTAARLAIPADPTPRSSDC